MSKMTKQKKKYNKEKKDYYEFLRNKKKERSEKIIKWIKDDKTNKRRKKRENVSEKISLIEWTEHFKEKDDENNTLKELLGEKEKQKETEGKIENDERKKGNEENEWYITGGQIIDSIKELKKKKAVGMDMIPNEACIYGKENITKDMEIILDNIRKENKIPKEWNTSIIAPIYKNGNKERTSNYRGTSLLDTGYKIFADIIQKELDKDIEEKNILSETQFGFRRKRSTIDGIYCMNTIIREEIKKEKGKVIVFFADLKAAFDNINRKELCQCMKKKGIKNEITKIVREIYKKTKARVRVKNELSEEIT